MEVTQIEKIRHSLSHIMAQAVLRLFPDTKLGIGPAIDNGFYYDFDFGDQDFSEQKLRKIEKEMKKIIKRNLAFTQEMIPREGAIERLKTLKAEYKLELLDGIEDDPLSFFITGDGEFTDLCRGPHVQRTSEIPIDGFRLIKTSGAYWRGDEKNKMLTRIYGYAFETKEELETYIYNMEEAAKRDHRKLGPELGLFMFSEIVGPGLPIFLPQGNILRETIEDYIKEKKKEYGHQFVTTPHMAKSDLYIKSKHWQKYDAMIPPINIDGDEYTLKPMNCPHHFQVYLNEKRSYRDLPLIIAENAVVYRFEKSGELGGLLRVRGLTQDDSHWFIRPDQIGEQVNVALELMSEIYNDFGMTDFRAEISAADRDNMDNYLGDPAMWDEAESKIEGILKTKEIEYKVNPGEAAFYGPKIDLQAKDTLGREWQLMTIQLDFNQPDNFDMTFTNSEGEDEKVVVLHIAILGSFERFMAIMIENYAGAFPLWLAPTQVKILPISGEKHGEYAHEVAQRLKEQGIRVEVGDKNERIQKRIRQAELAKVPYIAVVGDKEAETNTVAVRIHSKQDQGLQTVDEFINNLNEEINSKTYYLND